MFDSQHAEVENSSADGSADSSARAFAEELLQPSINDARSSAFVHGLKSDGISNSRPFQTGGMESVLGISLAKVSDKEAALLSEPESELSLSKALAPFAIMAGAGLATGGAYYLLTAASRRAARIDVLRNAAHQAHSEFRDAINYLASATGKPTEIVANSQGLLNGKMQLHLGSDIGFGVGNAGKWLVKQKDGGILVKSEFGDPYVRFFQGGAFESGSNYKMDMGNFFISPRRSLHVTTDGSSIYWERGLLGRLQFKPSEAAKTEPWAQSVQSMIEKADSQVVKNIILTQHQRGMNLNAGLARELRGSNVKEAFSHIPKESYPFGVGREAVVFRKPDGDVLRLTRTPVERPQELKEFLLPAKETLRGAGWQMETLPYVDKFVLGKAPMRELESGLGKLGYRLSDGHYGNLRMMGDKAVVIDPGAIEKAGPMISYWEAAKRVFRRDWQVVKKDLFGK